MSLTNLVIIRKLSFFPTLLRPALSASYKSQTTWNERFKCGLLSNDEDLIKSINNKILSDIELNNLELDVFLNISSPRTDDIVQLQESAKLLRKFRKSLISHRLLPSSSHATCRLFLYSDKINSLVSMMENRVEYGIFPDHIMTNILLDSAIESENYLLGSRIAALVMLQEEFGINKITDALSLYTTIKYIESCTNFEDWSMTHHATDPVLNETDVVTESIDSNTDGNVDEPNDNENAGDDDDDEEEEDAEYIRVPWLRNPYFDNHFDVKSPRIICGKTLTSLVLALDESDQEITLKVSLLASILQAKWQEAQNIVNKCTDAKISLGPLKGLLEHYIGNLQDLDKPDDQLLENLISSIKDIQGESSKLSELIENKCDMQDQEVRDIKQLQDDIVSWSNLRQNTLKMLKDSYERRRLVEEVRARKEELRRKEQFLYFYDNLKKSNVTRLQYD